MTTHTARSRRYAPATLACTLFVCLVPFVSQAQTLGRSGAALKQLTLEELANVEITSVTKEPESVWHTAAAVHVLTEEDIARSGATSVPDVLRLVPGVDVARVDTSRNWVVGIRGFGDQFSKSVLVLIDGRAAYTPLWAGVHWPIQDMLLEDIERIEVIRGPGGTIWGANAQNGVINIITKSARETHGLYASAIAGNVDQAIGAVRFGASMAAGLDYRGYAKVTKRAPQYHRDGRAFDTWEMGQAGFRVDWQHGRRDEVTLQGDAYTAELGESVRVSTFAPPSSFLVDDPVDLKGANLRAEWRRALDDRSDIRVQGYFDYTYRLGTDWGERRHTFDIDASHRWRQSSRQEIIWGVGARTSPSRIIQTYAFSNFEPHDHTFNLLSAFVQDSLTLVPDRFTVIGGLKLERNSFTGLEIQPSGRASWTITGKQTIWGALTRAVRTPSRVDEDITVSFLAASNPLVYGVITGNAELQPETVLSAEGGYRALLGPSVYVDLTAFHNRYDNLVDVGAPSSETRTTEGVQYTALVFPWINGNEGRTRGFEIAPRWQVSGAVRLSGSYSYVNIAVDAKPDNTMRVTLPTLEGSTPRHQVVVQSMMSVGRGIQIDPLYRYVAARAQPQIPGYHTADLHLRFPLAYGFEASLVGQNLLDAHHPEWGRDPGPTVEIRRSGYVQIVWRR